MVNEENEDKHIKKFYTVSVFVHSEYRSRENVLARTVKSEKTTYYRGNSVNLYLEQSSQFSSFPDKLLN